MAKTDKERFSRLSPAAKRLLRDIQFHRHHGLNKYHGQASTDKAKIELEDARLISVNWGNGRSEADIITLKPAGARIAEKMCPIR